MGERGRERVVARYSLRVALPRVADIVRDVAGRTKGTDVAVSAMVGRA
jgi:hypothetical protein